MTGYTPSNIAENEERPAPALTRWMAHLFSYVFHPLFVPVYVTLFLIFLHPLLFAGYSDGAKLRLLATVAVNLMLFPAATVFFAWRLGFISSVKLDTQKERLIPLAAAMIFYFWCWFVLKNFAEVPALFKQFLLGSFITIIAAWLTNIFFKISLHALAMGGVTAFAGLLLYQAEGGSGAYLAAAIFIAGLVCSARLLLSAHQDGEVYAGFFIGMLCQVLAVYL